jgi:hypothetical protein
MILSPLGSNKQMQGTASRLINIAKKSTMGSRHACAIVSGKKVLAVAVNEITHMGESIELARAISSPHRVHCTRYCTEIYREKSYSD